MGQEEELIFIAKQKDDMGLEKAPTPEYNQWSRKVHKQ